MSEEFTVTAEKQVVSVQVEMPFQQPGTMRGVVQVLMVMPEGYNNTTYSSSGVSKPMAELSQELLDAINLLAAAVMEWDAEKTEAAAAAAKAQTEFIP